MNQNFAGSVLLLIIAAAGFQTNTPAAWWLAGITAGLAFLASEVRNANEFTGSPKLTLLGTAIALLSWLTVAAAAYSLI